VDGNKDPVLWQKAGCRTPVPLWQILLASRCSAESAFSASSKFKPEMRSFALPACFIPLMLFFLHLNTLDFSGFLEGRAAEYMVLTRFTIYLFSEIT
jgi:hypothetical protein